MINSQPTPVFWAPGRSRAPICNVAAMTFVLCCASKPSAKTSACNPFGAIVKTDPIIPDDQGGRVLHFRPRGAPPGSPPPRGGWRWQAEPDSPVDDLAKYERNETSDDYRHRMTMNLLTLVFATLLIAVGV
jgi:hypothetical protein